MWKPGRKQPRAQVTAGSETVPATAAELAQIAPVRTALTTLLSSGAPTPAEQKTFLTDATVVRYLRARSHDAGKAAEMLAATLRFRRAASPRPGTVCASCSANPRCHSFYPIGPCASSAPPGVRAGLGDVTPLMYSNYDVTDRHTTTVVNHMLWCMDEIFDNASLHRMVWIMDFHAFSRADVSPTTAKHVLGLFADHYPERLGNAVIYDAPYVFQTLWAAVKLFAAPETVRKVVFVKHNEADRRAKFEALNIQGEVYERVCREIDEARDKKTQAEKNWWAVKPLEPIPHFGVKTLGRE